jgi:hypothetical protein
MMLEDKEAVKAEIEVENINGSILLIRYKDDQWPATEMLTKLKRLQQNNFKHYYSHIKLNGHIAPLKISNLYTNI